MDYKIKLAVDGVTPSEPDTRRVLAGEAFEDFLWATVDGQVTATLYPDIATDPVAQATEAAHLIEHSLPGSKVLRVDEDVVSMSEIAERTGLNRETVRTWVTGSRGPGGFPRPRVSLGGGSKPSVKGWAWADVVQWLNEHIAYEDNFRYLTAAQVAQVNAHLTRCHEPVSDVWQTVVSPDSPSHGVRRLPVTPATHASYTKVAGLSVESWVMLSTSPAAASHRR